MMCEPWTDVRVGTAALGSPVEGKLDPPGRREETRVPISRFFCQHWVFSPGVLHKRARACSHYRRVSMMKAKYP